MSRQRLCALGSRRLGPRPTTQRLFARAAALLFLTLGASSAQAQDAPDTPPETRTEPAPAPSGELPPADWLPPTRPVPAAALLPPSSDEADRDAVDPLLYAGLGTAALGAAGMVVFGIAQSRIAQLEDDPDFARYRAGQPLDSDVCEAADRGQTVEGAPSPVRVRDICSEGERWEAISFVTLPTSLALLGVATYLIVSSSAVSGGGDHATVSLRPTVGPRGGALVVEGRF